MNFLLLSIFILFLGLGIKLSTFVLSKSHKACMFLCWIAGLLFAIININSEIIPRFLCYFAFILSIICLVIAFKIPKWKNSSLTRKNENEL